MNDKVDKHWIRRCLRGIDSALLCLPYNEDLGPGTQLRRDWIFVKDKLEASKTRLTTMLSK